MLIEISDPALIENLSRFLERCECRPRDAGSARLSVSAPAELSDPRLARLQIEGYLRTWCSMHAGVNTVFRG